MCKRTEYNQPLKNVGAHADISIWKLLRFLLIDKHLAGLGNIPEALAKTRPLVPRDRDGHNCDNSLMILFRQCKFSWLYRFVLLNTKSYTRVFHYCYVY